MEIKNFNIDFVLRTKRILTDYQGDLEVSNLINCTLGLLILPYESVKNNPPAFWKTDIANVEELSGIRIKRFDPIKKIRNGRITRYPKTVKVFLQKIRNGLAHQHIQAINDGGNFTGITITNNYDKNNRDLEIEFTHEELRKFALFISKQYLKLADTP